MNAIGRSMTGAALAIALGLGGGALAQQPQQGGDQDHTAHHPDTAQATPPAQPPASAQPPAPAQRGAPGMPMMGQGGPGGMMMGGDMGRMMQMMQRMMAAQGGIGGPGAMQPFRRVEGQLAFFRAELHITDAQTPQWNAFADAVRAATEKLRQSYAQAMQPAGERTTAPDQLERRIALLSAQLDATRSVAAVARPLYAALTEEQKRTADELMAEHLRDMRRRGL